MGVVHKEVSEQDLWRLTDYVEDAFSTDPLIKRDGVCKLILDSTCQGTGSSLETFLSFLKNQIRQGNDRDGGPHLLRYTVLNHPNSWGVYGHKTEECFFTGLDDEEKKCFLADSFNITDNCCMSVLEKDGEDALLDHFFEDSLSAMSTTYQNHSSMPTLDAIKKSSEKEFKLLQSYQNKVNIAEDYAQKARIVRGMLRKCRKNEEYCQCDLCIADNSSASTNVKGVLYGTGLPVRKDGFYMSKNFSLSFLCALGILSALKYFYPGVSMPFSYLGTLHSFFPCHIEDLSLFSINFLHYGFPKLWIVIRPSDVAKLDYHLSRTRLNGFNLNCRNNLGHKYHIPTVRWLRSKGIRFSVVLQKAGEAVVVGPNAAHFGFNLGCNVAEAANFGTKSWIPYGIMAPMCSCFDTFIHPDLSAIIYQLAPQHLEAYLQKSVVTVPDDPHFEKCLVQTPYCDKPCGSISTSDPSHFVSAPITTDERRLQKPKRIVQRKKISCPVCHQTYLGGQKGRFLRHMNTVHSHLDAPAQEAAEAAIRDMFPDYGNRHQKRPCPKCGKLIGSSMIVHQKSSACLEGVSDTSLICPE